MAVIRAISGVANARHLGFFHLNLDQRVHDSQVLFYLMPYHRKHTNRPQDHAFASNRSKTIAIITFLTAVIGAISGVATAPHVAFFHLDHDRMIYDFPV